MRSFEDKWVWLRSQLEDDADTLLERAVEAAEAGEHVRAGYISHRLSGVRIALDHMNLADRNGPVEPL